MEWHALIRVLCILQLIIWAHEPAKASSYDTLYIDSAFKEIQLGRYVRFMSDSSNKMTIDDFLESSTPTRATLSANLRGEVTIGYGQSQHWLQMHFVNTSNQPMKLYLSLAYPNLDQVLIYQRIRRIEGDQVDLIANVGDNIKRGNKLIGHRNYVIPLLLTPETGVDYILQIKNQWEPLNFPLYLSNEYYFVRRTNNDNLFLGLYFGFHFTFVLLLLSLFLFTRNNFIFYYLIINVLTIINIISDTGLGLQYLWDEAPYIQKILPYILTFGTLIIHITFIRQFFSTALRFERYNQFLLGLMGLILFTSVGLFGFALGFPLSNLPYQISYGVINTLYFGYGIVILSLSIVAFYQIRRKEILWVLLIVIIHFVYWMFNILYRGNAFPIFLKGISIYQFNFFPGHLYTPHVIFGVILLEILTVSMILASNFYTFIKDNSASKYKLLLLQRKTINAYIEGQEKERSRLANKINDRIKEDIALLKVQMTQYLQKLTDPILRAKLNSIIQEVEKIDNDVSRITTNFVPEEYANKSLNNAARSIYNPLKAAGIEVRYQLMEPSPIISEFSKVNVCRILQEIAGNIGKHANATLVELEIKNVNDQLQINIHDNGIGFNIDHPKGGIGLLNISSRVKGLNGQLKIDSQTGNGTFISMTIPLKELK